MNFRKKSLRVTLATLLLANGHAVVTIFDRRRQEDERDRAFELRAARRASFVPATGALRGPIADAPPWRLSMGKRRLQLTNRVRAGGGRLEEVFGLVED